MLTSSQHVSRGHAHDAPAWRAQESFVDRDADLPDALQLYQRAGGVQTCDAVACLLRPHVAQPVSMVARWLVERRIIAFDWRARTFIPLFQFSLRDMSPRADVLQVVAMLAPVFDAAQLALWFVQPNTALAGSTPLETLQGESPALAWRAAACNG